jgi:hypothetical protein
MAKGPTQTKNDNLRPWLARIVFYPSIVALLVAALLGVDRYLTLTPFVLVLLGLAGLTEFTYLFESMLDRVRRAEGHNVALKENLVGEQSARTEREQHTNSLKLLAERTVLEADRIKANAEAEAEALLTEAHAEADRMRSDAAVEGERLKSESLQEIGEQWRQIEAARSALVQAQLSVASYSRNRVQTDLATFQRQITEQFDALNRRVAELARGWAEMDTSLGLPDVPQEVFPETDESDPPAPESTGTAA